MDDWRLMGGALGFSPSLSRLTSLGDANARIRNVVIYMIWCDTRYVRRIYDQQYDAKYQIIYIFIYLCGFAYQTSDEVCIRQSSCNIIALRHGVSKPVGGRNKGVIGIEKGKAQACKTKIPIPTNLPPPMPAVAVTGWSSVVVLACVSMMILLMMDY